MATGLEMPGSSCTVGVADGRAEDVGRSASFMSCVVRMIVSRGLGLAVDGGVYEW